MKLLKNVKSAHIKIIKHFKLNIHKALAFKQRYKWLIRVLNDYQEIKNFINSHIYG